MADRTTGGMNEGIAALDRAIFGLDVALATNNRGFASSKIPEPYNLSIYRFCENFYEADANPDVKRIYWPTWRWSCGACMVTSEHLDSWQAAFDESREHLKSHMHALGIKAHLKAIYFAQTGHVS